MKVILKTPRWKGEFAFDVEEEPLTALEWRWVKKVSGYLPFTIDEGLKGGDPDLFVAFSVVALHRAGRIQAADALNVAEQLLALPFDGTAITLVGDEQEAEDDPPDVPAATPATERPNGSTGPSSRPTSVPLV